jgi:carbon-monoxide dehydrogenase large subunit
VYRPRATPGRAGAVGAERAAGNALADAVSPLGVRDLAMPATPERLWRAIRDTGVR